MDTMNWPVVYPEIWLLVMACAVLLVDLWSRDAERRTTFWLTQLTIAGFALLHAMRFAEGDTAYGMGGMVVVDPMGHLLAAFAGLAVMVTLAYARPTLASRDMLKGEFYLLALLSLLGISVMCSANHFLVVYLGLELMSLSLYALVALRRDHAVATEAAMKYFVLGALASGFLLYGLSMMYGATGTLEIPKVFEAIAAGGINREVLVLGIVFVVAGLAFKLGAAPFHMWLPDVYQGAPTAVTTFIGSAPKLAAFAMAYRLLETALGGLSDQWGDMLSLLAVASLAVGNLAAIMQSNLKRMLAYSTISHVGFLLLGLVQGTPAGYAAALFYAIVYALMSAGAFGMIQWLARRGFEAEEIADLKGLHQRAPWAAFMMLLFMASLAGVPPLVGFFGKLMVLKAVIDAGRMWLAVSAVVFAVIGAWYYLRVIKAMYFDPPEGADAMPSRDAGISFGLSANGLAQLGLGLYWGPLIAWCLRAFA